MLEHLFSCFRGAWSTWQEHVNILVLDTDPWRKSRKSLGSSHTPVVFGWNAIICIQPVECILYILYQLPSPSKVSLKPVVPDLVLGNMSTRKKYGFTVSQIKHIKVSSLTCPVFAAKYPVSHFTLNLTTIYGFPWFSHGFPWFSHGFPMVFHQVSHPHPRHRRRCTATPEARPRRRRPRVPWPSSRRAAS